MSDADDLVLGDFSIICRTCLQHYDEDSLLSLNELYIIEGEVRLMDILVKYAQIEEIENYPQKICADCILKAEAAYCFFAKCKESDFILNQFGNINDQEEIPDNNDTDVASEQSHNFEIIKVISDESQEDMEIKIIFDEHQNNDVEDSSHVDSNDENFSIDQVATLPTNDQYSIEKCKFCNIELQAEHMEKHKTTFGHNDDSENIKCLHCKMITKNITNFKKHLRRFHSNRKESKKYFCHICDKVFKWSKNYEEHLRQHNSNPEDEEVCPQCGILLSNKTALQIHKGKEHVFTANTTWNCRHCPAVFKQIAEYKKHLREFHSEIDYHCCICGKDCGEKRILYYHEQLHLDEYGIECSYCGKKLLTEEKLILHERIHKYVKRKHVCSFCNKGFKQLDKLEAHERVHTGEKPFTCEVCGKAFNHQNNLMHHKRLHTGDTPYKCLFCSQQFSNSHSLRKHMRNHESILSDKTD